MRADVRRSGGPSDTTTATRERRETAKGTRLHIQPSHPSATPGSVDRGSVVESMLPRLA